MRTISSFFLAGLLGLSAVAMAAPAVDTGSREQRMSDALSDYRHSSLAAADLAPQPMAMKHHARHHKAKHHKAKHHQMKPLMK